jgi:hypothetical protein
MTTLDPRQLAKELADNLDNMTDEEKRKKLDTLASTILMEEPNMEENEWDERYGSINNTPLDLDEHTLGALDPHYLWTQSEDGEGHDLLTNGAAHRWNFVGYWISQKPWIDGDRTVVRWGGSWEYDEGDYEDPEDTTTG